MFREFHKMYCMDNDKGIDKETEIVRLIKEKEKEKNTIFHRRFSTAPRIGVLLCYHTEQVATPRGLDGPNQCLRMLST